MPLVGVVTTADTAHAFVVGSRRRISVVEPTSTAPACVVSTPSVGSPVPVSHVTASPEAIAVGVSHPRHRVAESAAFFQTNDAPSGPG